MARATVVDQRMRRTVGVVRGVNFGRFQFRLEVTKAQMKALDEFVTGLIQAEDVDTLRYIKNGGGQYLQIAHRRKLRGENAVTTQNVAPLKSAFEEWLSTATTKSGRPRLAKCIRHGLTHEPRTDDDLPMRGFVLGCAFPSLALHNLHDAISRPH